ncbi:DNA-binding response regulator [Grimontia hollisae]|uniref:Transcriptional regulatory protein CusR n=2 Tax=Grimontia hollisae TaxID=673 RepID=A0A377J7A5_GRIHO|nr:response regulator transcription factor [Grimontia hollisae]AMG28928.1 DNA-binding response regulator [Grimontia hollisae]EEY71861.1 probable two-component response regulator protein [Grimontia hollisae CIP 101886]MDF2184730.1 response regulator transcription factor [Grimontia hollisae]STO77247.1 Transcriptional regulatory protein CusR [Grimontia hollisae]STO98371.1 Transcriptional regulatory protein CusR [Grimontia hollisae]
MRVLLVEDDVSLSSFVEKGLREAGHQVEVTDNGKHALTLCMAENYDVAIVDRMLPGLDGLSLVKALRAAQVGTPILFLTALGGVDDRVEGLEAGGDDYLTKPFAFSELLARVTALSRRAVLKTTEAMPEISYGDVVLNLFEHSATRRGQPLDLQPKEFRILELFLRHPGRVITRTMLLEHVWDIHFDPQTSVVETHISRLRNKLEKPFGDTLIQTVRGVGYKLEQKSGEAK